MKDLSLFFGFTFLLLSFSVFETSAQSLGQTDTIQISDIRDQGVAVYDTSTAGHEVNEVSVDRCLKENSSSMPMNYYGAEAYQIHFFKMFEGKLRNYQMSLICDVDFDKAAYEWLDDITVSVTLFNSTTGFRKNIKLVQTFSKSSSAGVVTESLNPRY